MSETVYHEVLREIYELLAPGEYDGVALYCHDGGWVEFVDGDQEYQIVVQRTVDPELARLRKEVRAARECDDEMRLISSGFSLGEAMDRYREIRAQNAWLAAPFDT